MEYIFCCCETKASTVKVCMILEASTYTVRGNSGNRRGEKVSKMAEFLRRSCVSKKSKIFTSPVPNVLLYTARDNIVQSAQSSFCMGRRRFEYRVNPLRDSGEDLE